MAELLSISIGAIAIVNVVSNLAKSSSYLQTSDDIKGRLTLYINLTLEVEQLWRTLKINTGEHSLPERFSTLRHEVYEAAGEGADLLKAVIDTDLRRPGRSYYLNNETFRIRLDKLLSRLWLLKWELVYSLRNRQQDSNNCIAPISDTPPEFVASLLRVNAEHLSLVDAESETSTSERNSDRNTYEQLVLYNRRLSNAPVNVNELDQEVGSPTTPDDIDITSIVPNAQVSLWSCICWHIYACTFIFTVGSLVFGITYTLVKDDIGGAFTVAGYILTMGAIVVALLAGKHNEACVEKRNNAKLLAKWNETQGSSMPLMSLRGGPDSTG